MATPPCQHLLSETAAFRLRTPRRRRRVRLDHRDKQLLALHRERTRLSHQRRALPWIPLDPPVTRGWKRSFVLRDDVARGNDAPLYERFLERINTVQLSPRRDFKKKKRSRGRKIHVATGQHLRTLAPWEWQRCAFSPAEAALFDLAAAAPNKPHEPPHYHYVFRDTWRYVLRIEPHVITRIRQRDEVLEAAETAIDRYLDRQDRRTHLNRLLHGEGYGLVRVRSDRAYTSRRPFRNIPLHALLLDA